MTNYLPQATFTRQKAALTRAVNRHRNAIDGREKDAAALQIETTVRTTVTQWNDGHYAWPDDWARWQRALDDSRPWNAPYIDIQAL